MYLTTEERRGLLRRLGEHFSRVELLMDCYTVFAAKASRYKNPINEVGVTQVYGMDDPREAGGALEYAQELDLTPEDLIAQLKGMEQTLFRKVFAGSASKKLYRLYAYRKDVDG